MEILTCENEHPIIFLSSELLDTPNLPECPRCHTQTHAPSMKPDAFDFTTLAAFRRCPRYAFYRHELHLKRTSESSLALNAGTLWHTLMCSWYGSQSLGLSREERILSAMETMLAQAKDMPDILSGDDPIRNPSHITEVFVAYTQKYGERDHFQVFIDDGEPYVEKGFSLEMWDGGPLFVGRVDGLVNWNGRLFVLEHKTTSRVTQAYMDKWRMDFQTPGYVYAIRELTGLPIVGTLINVAAWHKNIVPDKTFFRVPVTRNPGQMKMWKTQTIRWYQKYQEARESGEWDMNDGSCTMYNQVCPYMDICCATNPETQKTIIENNYICRPWAPLENLHEEGL